MQGVSIQGEAQGNGVELWLSPVIAVFIISVWAISLGFVLSLNLEAIPLLGKGFIVLWQMFLYTGLFITAHDAMHGALFPLNRVVNDGMGTVVLWLYGLFSYQELRDRHQQHHQCPASSQDPDFAVSTGFGAWYGAFMTRYWSWKRLGALIILFALIHNCLGVPEANLALGWVYPSILSSLHLFYFGTYLPHRQPAIGYLDHHRSTTIPRPFWMSLLACYHFGYHYEHHAYPQVPWWRLPKVYREKNSAAQIT